MIAADFAAAATKSAAIMNGQKLRRCGIVATLTRFTPASQET